MRRFEYWAMGAAADHFMPRKNRIYVFDVLEVSSMQMRNQFFYRHCLCPRLTSQIKSWISGIRAQ